MPSYLLSNDAAECNRLFDALSVAIMRARSILQQTSVHDPKHMEADAEVSKILARVSEVLNPKTLSPMRWKAGQDELGE